MKSCNVVTLVSAVSCALEQCYSKEELQILSAIFNQLGDSLATIVTVQDVNQSRSAAAAVNNT